MSDWQDAQRYEHDWHISNNNCANSYGEETKQFDYAHRMGLDFYKRTEYGITWWDFGNQSVLDVGGGPYSLLLKSRANKMVVVDPCDYPNWVAVRYKECGIEYLKQKAEDMKFSEVFDIAVCYNVLQHVEDPAQICLNMRKYAKTIHFFDWLEIGVAPGHPHNLHKDELDTWLGGEGKMERATRGYMYYGIFKGDKWHE